MTTERLASTLEGDSSGLELGQVLSLCDRVLEEVGRRRHLFAWLRAPDAPAEEWLAVDAYYPANRLVVVWREQPGPDDRLYAELVPRHGLKLLELGPNLVHGDAEGAELSLRRLVAGLGPSPRRASEPQVREQPAAVPAVAAVPHSSQSVGLGIVEGVALVAVLFIEMYLGVVQGALDGGRLLLAFGLALDVCSRALGTIAANRAGSDDWAWLCALGGSPFVASFALFGRGGAVKVEPAPLAGLMGLVALGALAIALVSGA